MNWKWAALAMLLLGFAAGQISPALAQTEAFDTAEPGRLYVRFDPVSITVVRNARVSGLLSVTYSLAVRTEDEVTKITSLKPKLTAVIVRNLTLVARNRLDVRRSLEFELIERYMQRAVDDLLGENQAEVLIQLASLNPS